MIKLLIFDLDGTLLDTSEDITNSINYAVKPFGVKPLSTGAVKSLVGAGLTKLIEGLIISHERINDTASLDKKEETLKRFVDHYARHLLDKTSLYPQVEETLLKLVSYKKVVLSNKREVFTKQVLDGFGLSKYFDVILGSDSVSERKPSPVPIYKILKKFGVSQDEAVIIGDSNFDIDAGKAAGIRTIAVTYGYRPREVLKGADFAIDTFGELIDVLKKMESSAE
jgi:phosphoglycolate phosphatase